jgi:hypothetical protein
MALITQPTYFVSLPPTAGKPGDVDSSAKNTLGRQAMDVNGNIFIYLLGVASTVLGTWVTFDENHATTRAVANAQGRVAIATGATVASTYGWYQIYGEAEGLCLADFVTEGKVYLTSTDGSVDDADVGQDFVIGAVGRSARDTTTGTAVFELNFPMVQDTALD